MDFFLSNLDQELQDQYIHKQRFLIVDSFLLAVLYCSQWTISLVIFVTLYSVVDWLGTWLSPW